MTSGLATENIQALNCLCANPVPGSCSIQRRTHLCPLWAICGIPFLIQEVEIKHKTFRQCRTLLFDPVLATATTAMSSGWACSWCSCEISSIIVGGFWFLFKCNLIVCWSKSFKLFCCLFPPQLIFLALRFHMLPSPSRTTTNKMVRWVLYSDERNTRGKSDWVTYTHGMYIYTPECMKD